MRPGEAPGRHSAECGPDTPSRGPWRLVPNPATFRPRPAPAVPGSAEAVRQANRRDVNVIGLSLPNMNKPYVHDGWVQTVVLWNTRDLGYLTVLAGSLLTQNKISSTTSSFEAGRLGTIQIKGSEIILGAPVMFTKANIDKFDF